MIPKLVDSRQPFPPTGMLLALLLAGTSITASAADIGKGGALYATHCATCHGANGRPVMPCTPDFRRMEGLMRPDTQLLHSIRAGKGPMPAYFGVLRDREILDIVAYLRTLS